MPDSRWNRDQLGTQSAEMEDIDLSPCTGSFPVVIQHELDRSLNDKERVSLMFMHVPCADRSGAKDDMNHMTYLIGTNVPFRAVKLGGDAIAGDDIGDFFLCYAFQEGMR